MFIIAAVKTVVAQNIVNLISCILHFPQKNSHLKKSYNTYKKGTSYSKNPTKRLIISGKLICY